MANGLYPSFVRLYYHTAYAAHVQTIPTTRWSPGVGTNGSFASWDAGARDAEDMILDLVNKIKVVVPASTIYDEYIIYNIPAPGDDPQPVAQGAIDIAGTSVVTGWSEAVEQTFVLRTEAFGIFKLVLLDPVTSNFFGKVAPADFSSEYNDIMTQITSPSNAWSGRDNSRPNYVKGCTITLNEKLRRSYQLT